MGFWYGNSASLKGSEVWASVLKLVENAVIASLEVVKDSEPWADT